MKHTKIGSLMQKDVVKARYGTPFKEIVRLLGENRISGLPVVDEDERVIGVISETDLMLRQAEMPEPAEHARRHWPAPLRHATRRAAVKVQARTAGNLMTSPAVTVRADVSVARAARTMAQHRVERLPVVDENDRLVGIVTRHDLLQVFLRSDADIRQEVQEEVLERTLWLPSKLVEVTVHEGVVTLSGRLERRSEIPVALRMTAQVDGVVAVVDQLTYRFDDSHLEPAEQALHGVGGDWLRRL
ncbi:CBS domain-containing protein [Streptomyces sp. GC420]|uniref:CBS domain-containing protein n=1 Tax=Streptomyces sp. GC420 TaxID=2697568 RepID=UPI001414E3F0|nr:CBS domain-containing protein [Streptomyces sp. GC420]NBM20277.1 CBS domain-containing protein [Streptomyces sp. GC420]